MGAQSVMHRVAATLDADQLLRAGADELLPVIIDLGPQQARFATFLSAVDGDQLIVSPIAATFLPSRVDRSFRILPAAGPGDWFATATGLRPDGPSRARIDLSHAKAFHRSHASSERPVQATDVLVLVIVGGLDDTPSYVFPIERIGADVCEIRASVALVPGRDLPCVEVIGDRRLLRRASAQVLETVPSYSPDGGPSFCSRLSLRDELLVDAGHAYDVITEPAEVARLLRLAVTTQARCSYHAPEWGTGSARLSEVAKDSAWVEVDPLPVMQPDTVASFRICFELFATSYEIDMRPLQVVSGRLQSALPLIVRRRRRHRRDHRVRVTAPHHVEICFRNPITGEKQTHSVTDVSFFGLSFTCPAETVVLWRGLPLEHAELRWREHVIAMGDLTVRACLFDPQSGVIRCGTSIEKSEIADDGDMITMLSALAHPHVQVHDGENFSGLHQVYVKAGLFAPHMQRNLAPIMEQTQRIWRSLHSGASDLVRTFIHGSNEAPDAAVTVMRAWEHAWVAQHFVDVTTKRTGATGWLQTAYLDYIVPRADGRYLLFFIKADNRIMNAYLERFFDGMGTPDAVTRSTVELWSRAGDAVAPAAKSSLAQIRPARIEEEILVARGAQRCFGAPAAAALSMLPGEFAVPDTCARFAKAGLLRTRSCAIAERAGKGAYAVLEEVSTPGMNLTWMLNASWILPLHPEVDSDGAAFDAALADIIARPAQSPVGERFLNLPSGLDTERLEASGFTREATVFLYVLTRAGVHRFLSYASSRYGELGARTANRVR